MVTLDEGINEVALRHASDITKGQWGDDNTNPAVTDTGLISPIASTLITVAATNSGNSAQFTHTVPSTTANGNTLREFELQFDNGVSLNRTVGGDVAKTSSFIVTTISTVSFVRG
ncbi:unnamed protein product [marine sediment metagenome]|uniref:Uncharacterized protein n=1 Tax=marine sediment metagenome TaxID=412755 RepID=X0S5Q3_9ZZZZ